MKTAALSITSLNTIDNLTAVGSTLFFTALAPGIGRELWKSDGTDAGTVLVKDVVSGFEDSG